MSDKEKYDTLLRLFGEMYRLFVNECSWKFFREEMFNDSNSGKNAKIMSDWANEFVMLNPELWEDIKKVMK